MTKVSGESTIFMSSLLSTYTLVRLTNKIKPFTALLTVSALLAGLIISNTNYMSFLRSLLGSQRPAHTMVQKTPPKPTVPTAIRTSEQAQLGDGGACDRDQPSHGVMLMLLS
jgi:hypothetical protein